MLKQYEVTEIVFPAFPIGEGALSMLEHRQAFSTTWESRKNDRRRRFRATGLRQAPLAMRQHRGTLPSLPTSRRRRLSCVVLFKHALGNA